METKKSTINFDSIDVENNKYKEVKLNELLSKQLKKDEIEKKPIDIFANLKTKDSKTPLEQTMLDFVKDIKN